MPPGSDVWEFSDAATDDVGGAGAWVGLKKHSTKMIVLVSNAINIM